MVVHRNEVYRSASGADQGFTYLVVVVALVVFSCCLQEVFDPNYQISYKIYSLVPRLPYLFNAHEKRGGLESNVTCVT